MGCGASKAVSAVGPQPLEAQRDAEDYSLEPVTLQITNIDEFDGVFARLCALLNRLVELNNGVHCAVADVKAAYAAAAGGFSLDVEFGPASDRVLLDLRNSRGERPLPEALATLAATPHVKAADTELEDARHALHAHLSMHASGQTLRVGRDNSLIWAPPASPSGVPAPEPVVHFNACLAKLRSALEGTANVCVSVVPAVAPGTPTIQASMRRDEAESLGFRTAGQPVTVLDVCSTPLAEHIQSAQAFLCDRAQALAHRTKGLDMQWDVSTSYAVTHANAIENEDIQDQVDRLVRGVNLALFRLLNGCASVSSHASLTNAVVEVLRPVLAAVKAKHGSSHLAHRMRHMVSVRPEVEFQNEEEGVPPSFDFQFNVNVSPEAQVPAFPACLNELSLNILAAIEGLKHCIAGALLELPGISAETDDLLERAKEFYELCPDATAQMGFSMMDAVRCSKATGSNLKTLYETQELFLSFGENIKRVADELADSTYAVQGLIESMLPDGLEQVEEGEHEGMETPMSRALSLQSQRLHTPTTAQQQGQDVLAMETGAPRGGGATGTAAAPASSTNDTASVVQAASQQLAAHGTSARPDNEVATAPQAAAMVTPSADATDQPADREAADVAAPSEPPTEPPGKMETAAAKAMDVDGGTDQQTQDTYLKAAA